MQDSNLRPPAPKAGALPDCANIRLLYLTICMSKSQLVGPLGFEPRIKGL